MLAKALLLAWLCAAACAELFNETSLEENLELELFQGDIRLTEEQKVLLKERKALTSLSSRWPLTVPYRFGDNSVDRDGVRAGIKHWEENTCLRFQETTSTTGSHLKFIISDGCWSYLGKLSWNGQEVGLARGCTNSMGIVAHEIGHAMGFYHEQSRTDRDDYVNIMWDNIQEKPKHNFNKAGSMNAYGVKYDYSSVMHYGRNGFAKDYSKNTIETKDPLGQSLIGTRTGLSHMDILLANRMYGCIDQYATKCSVQTDHCANDGILRPDCSCRCAPGTSGSRCQNLEKSYLNAVSDKRIPYTTITASSGSLQNPSYPRAGTFEVYKRILQAPVCYEIRLTFSTFALDPSNCVGFFVYLTVDGKTMKHCGTTSPGSITSVGNKVSILYGSVGSSSSSIKGFQASYQFVKKTTCDPTATTTTPSSTPSPTTTTPTTAAPGSFQIINSGAIPVKAESNCSHSLTHEYGTRYRLKASYWRPDCLIKLYTDEPRLLRIKANSVPYWLYTYAHSLFGKSTRIYRTRRRVFQFENSVLELSQTSWSITYYYYAAYYGFRYSTLDLTIDVFNKDCNKLVKMSASSSGSVTIPRSYSRYDTCEIWASSPMGSPITVKLSKPSSIGRSCSRGRVFVDTAKGHYHLYRNVELVCPANMPVSKVSQGCSAGVFVYQYRNYLQGLVVSFST